MLDLGVSESSKPRAVVKYGDARINMPTSWVLTGKYIVDT
jgi:hypothetical protein